MKYKVVKNDKNQIIAFGPNDDNYEPHIADGQILSLQDEEPIFDTTEADAQAVARQAVLDKLGLTADEAAALLG
jgi:hypothetical protein